MLARAAKSIPTPGTTVIPDSMSASCPWPLARSRASTCAWLVPGGTNWPSWLPIAPSKMMFVALPSSFGPITAAVTLNTARTMTTMTFASSGRSSPTSRRNVPRKSRGLAAGSIPPPNIPPGPRPP